MADRLDVVAVGVEHESAVIVGMINFANAGGTVVSAARRDRRLIKSIHRGAIVCPKDAMRPKDAVSCSFDCFNNDLRERDDDTDIYDGLQ